MEKARFKWVLRERNRKIAAKTEAFTEQQARRVRSFHSSFKESNTADRTYQSGAAFGYQKPFCQR